MTEQMIDVNIVLRKKRMKFYIFETDANLAISAIWANHCNRAKLGVFDWLDELEYFVFF